MSDDEAPIVQTTVGAVRGRWRDDGSAAFLGVPFARAPVGALRFAAPAPVTPWDGVRDAVAFGPTPQRWMAPDPLIPEPSVPGDATLNVNVITPTPGVDARLPVMVWIHGGGYVSGSPASPWYNGGAFARDGIVTVVVSYRLGFDGFGWIEGTPQNRGVLDWLAALEWVQREIGGFGGDPARVTIAGQSAGGNAVLRLLALPAAQHLFRSVIALSPPVLEVGVTRARAIADRLAATLGVESTRAGFASVTEKQIEHHQIAAGRERRRGVPDVRAALVDAVPYGPVVDGTLIREPLLQALARGVGSGKPLLIGTTDDEFAMITTPYRRQLRFMPVWLALLIVGIPASGARAYRRANRRIRGSAKVIGRFVTDHFFRAFVRRVAEARTSATDPGRSAPTWAYRFAWRSTSHGIAIHCLDVPFYFDVLAEPEMDQLSLAALTGAHPPRALADAVHGSAAAFIRDGVPGWEAWSSERRATRVYDVVGADVITDGYAETTALG